MRRKERTPLQNLRLARRPPTLTELAREMGCDHSSLSRFERGLIRQPSDDFLKRYVRAMRKLGVHTTQAETLRALAGSIPDESPGRSRAPRQSVS